MLQGTIPFLPELYISQKLEPHHRNLLQLAMDRQLPQGDEITADIDAVLDALGLSGVWGKRPDGYTFVRAFLMDDEHFFVHTKTYAWDDQVVPVEVRTRRFTFADNPDEMFVKIMTQCHAYNAAKKGGPEEQVLPEDHPEMDAVGFRLVEANETWLIQRPVLIQAIKLKQSIHPEALTLMQTANQRRVLGQLLATGFLKNIHTGAATLLSKGRGVVKEQRNAEERIRVDLTSKPLAEAFLKRARRKA